MNLGRRPDEVLQELAILRARNAELVSILNTVRLELKGGGTFPPQGTLYKSTVAALRKVKVKYP